MKHWRIRLPKEAWVCCVLCEVLTESLYEIQIYFHLQSNENIYLLFGTFSVVSLHLHWQVRVQSFFLVEGVEQINMAQPNYTQNLKSVSGQAATKVWHPRCRANHHVFIIPGVIVHSVQYSRTHDCYTSLMDTTATETKVFQLKLCGCISYNNSLSWIFHCVIHTTWLSYKPQTEQC